MRLVYMVDSSYAGMHIRTCPKSKSVAALCPILCGNSACLNLHPLDEDHIFVCSQDAQESADFTQHEEREEKATPNTDRVRASELSRHVWWVTRYVSRIVTKHL